MSTDDMEPRKDSGAAGCIAKIVSIGLKLFIVLVVVVVGYMAYVAYTPGVDKPDWLMKGYTNKHYRAGEKHAKNKEYAQAVYEYELALQEAGDNEGMAYDSRMNIAWNYEQLADSLEKLSWEDSPEGREAAQKQNEARDRALGQYNIVLKENPKDKTADQRRALLMLSR